MEDGEARLHHPRVVFVDERNRIREVEKQRPGPAPPSRRGLSAWQR